jgi:hypothetical protein
MKAARRRFNLFAALLGIALFCSSFTFGSVDSASAVDSISITRTADPPGFPPPPPQP